MRKNYLQVGLVVSSLFLSISVNANPNGNMAYGLSRGQSPLQAAYQAALAGRNPGQIKNELVNSGVSNAVASSAASMAQNHVPSIAVNNGLPPHIITDYGLGRGLAGVIRQFLHIAIPPNAKGLISIIRAFKEGWPGPHPPGPSPS